MFDSEYYWELRNLNKRVPVLTYENDLDGYTLFEKIHDPYLGGAMRVFVTMSYDIK